MHTTPETETSTDTTQLTLRDLQQVMIRVQIKALETLERLMDDQKLTGDEKVDKAKAIERNRQRLSATQTLVHCRAVQRELRERRELAHRIRQDERLAAKKAPHELASLRRLHKLHPDEYDDPDTPPPSPLAVVGGDRSQIVRRMRGRPEPSDRPDNTTSGGAADPSPHPDHTTPTHWRTSAQCHKEQQESPKPFPTDIGKTLAAQINAVAGSTRGLHT
ncbi:MAG: hypothetical protein ACF8MJ_11495 [Phycisphaerales bacterium JB050]